MFYSYTESLIDEAITLEGDSVEREQSIVRHEGITLESAHRLVHDHTMPDTGHGDLFVTLAITASIWAAVIADFHV